MRIAELTVIRLLQIKHFSKERETLITSGINPQNYQVKRKYIKKVSPLFKLDIFLDENNLIRVGGRLQQSELQDSCKFPLLLPKSAQITNVIIRWIHQQVEHAGRGVTFNEIRNYRFWIVNANSVVRYIISKCVKCRFLCGKCGTQKMADLPKDRLTPAPPFTYCAVDMFGPFMI